MQELGGDTGKLHFLAPVALTVLIVPPIGVFVAGAQYAVSYRTRSVEKNRPDVKRKPPGTEIMLLEDVVVEEERGVEGGEVEEAVGWQQDADESFTGLADNSSGVRCTIAYA